MKGVIYLEDTSAEQGALRVVPGFHRRLANTTLMLIHAQRKP